MEHIFPRTNRRASQKSRLLFGITGGALVLYGMKRRSFFGGLLSLAGADMVTHGLTGHHLHETLGITSLASQSGTSIRHQLGVQVQRSITVSLPPEEAYEFVRNIENFPQFMKHVKSIEATDNTRSHWVVDGPAGTEVEWDAEIINDVPNELIAWRSINSPDVDTAGSIRFEDTPQGRGTTIRVSLQYVAPAGVLGVAVAKLFGRDPEAQIKSDLGRLKQILETGEVTTTTGQPAGGLRGRRESEKRREQAAAGGASETPPYLETELEPKKSRSATASGSSQ